MPNDRFPAGQPAARHSAFYWRDWEPQCKWGDQQSAKLMRDAQTERIERARATGDTTGTIARLSNKSAKLLDVTKSYWNGAVKEPTKGKHGGAYSKAKRA